MCVQFGKLLESVFHPRLSSMPAIVKIHLNYVKNLMIILYLLVNKRLIIVNMPANKAPGFDKYPVFHTRSMEKGRGKPTTFGRALTDSFHMGQ
jgi:hypothetical protein